MKKCDLFVLYLTFFLKIKYILLAFFLGNCAPFIAKMHRQSFDYQCILFVFRELCPPLEVEPGGVEPPSKLAAEMLSTRLVSVCLSARGRYGTNQPRAYLLNFAHAAEPALAIHPFMILRSGRRMAGASGEASSASDLVRAPEFAAIRQRKHSCCHLLAKRVSF